MAASTDARVEIVTAYVAAGLTAFGYTPATLVPPVVVVEPASPWLVPTRVGDDLRATMRLRAIATVNLVDSATSQSALETLVEQVLAATPDGVVVESVDAPTIDSTASQGVTLTASVNLTAQIRS